MNEEKEKGSVNPKKNRDVIMEIVLIIVGIIVLINCLITGYNMMAIERVASNAVNTVPREFYNAMGKFVIGVGFFAGFLLWGIAYLVHKKR